MHDNEAADFLRKLASQNNGDYAYQNVKRFAEDVSPSRGTRSSIKPIAEPKSSSLPGR
jgi:hypothetical protein